MTPFRTSLHYLAHVALLMLAIGSSALAEVLTLNEWSEISETGSYALPPGTRSVYRSSCGGVRIEGGSLSGSSLGDCAAALSVATAAVSTESPPRLTVTVPDGAKLYLKPSNTSWSPKSLRFESEADRLARSKLQEQLQNELLEFAPEDFSKRRARAEELRMLGSAWRGAESEVAQAQAEEDPEGAVLCVRSSSLFAESLGTHQACLDAACPKKASAGMQSGCFPACLSDYRSVVKKLEELLLQCSSFYPERGCEHVGKFYEVCTDDLSCKKLQELSRRFCNG